MGIGGNGVHGVNAANRVVLVKEHENENVMIPNQNMAVEDAEDSTNKRKNV